MRFVMALLLLLGLAACGASGAEDRLTTAATEPVTEQMMTANALTTAIAASAQPPYDPAVLLNDLRTAVSLWESQQIQGYEVTVRYRQPTWDTQNMTLTVIEGVVTDVEHSCFPQQNCIMRDVDPTNFTVEALFKTAETVIGFNEPDTQLTFNKTYGFPTSILYPDGSWVLDGFKVLANE